MAFNADIMELLVMSEMLQNIGDLGYLHRSLRDTGVH